jgi:hypothetical protein
VLNSVAKLNDDAKALIETHVPAEICDSWGKPPLLPTENPNQYYALLVELVREVKPSDIIEWLWVKDVVDLTWDILRYRRLKAVHLKERTEADDEASIFRWSAIPMITTLEGIERILASAETRRNNALREIERRRALLGHALRQASDKVVDGDAPAAPPLPAARPLN